MWTNCKTKKDAMHSIHETAKRIAHDNMLAILPKQGAVLKADAAAPAEARQSAPVLTR